MDILTVLGLFLGVSVVAGVMHNMGILALMYDLNAAILVFGGTAASILIAYPWDAIKSIPKAVKVIFFPPKIKHFVGLISELTEYSVTARKEGVEFLGNKVSVMNDNFMKHAFTLVLSGMDNDKVRESLEREILETQHRHQKVGSVFRAMGTFAPIFGLLGTLIGVVTVLSALGKGGMEQGSLGEAFGKMRIAVTTTFYGIFGANFLFLPTAIKLGEYSSKELLFKRLIIEAACSIQQGEFPMVLAKKLDAFVSEELKNRKRPEK